MRSERVPVATMYCLKRIPRLTTLGRDELIPSISLADSPKFPLARITGKPEVEPMMRSSSLQKLENQNLDEGNWSPSALNLRKVVVCATDPLVLEDANKMGVN